jgi:ACS family glucarate transporter-like MFS transporter
VTVPIPRRRSVRWRIFGFLFAIGVLEYLQQRGLTVAAERMIPDLRFSQMQIGWVEQAFVIGYALCQIPGGVLGQRWGARATFTGIGVVSVVCIAATVAAPELWTGTALFVALFASQFLLGVGQAPTFPVSTGVFESWFPPKDWALVQGLQTMGLGLGGALAPPLIAILMTRVGWQQALLWTAVPAVPLFLWWAYYGRNNPREHRGVSTEELALLSNPASERTNAQLTMAELRLLLRNRHVLLLTLSYFLMEYTYYLIGNWCFLYLVQERHFPVLESGLLSAAPPLAAGIGSAMGGVIASALFVRLGSRRGLRIMPLVALPAAGLMLIATVHAANVYVAVLLLTICYWLIELTEGSYWAAVMTVGGRNSMTVGGIMNTGGSMAGVIGIPIVAYLSGHGAWNATFLLGAGLATVGAAIWFAIDASVSASSSASTDTLGARADRASAVPARS